MAYELSKNDKTRLDDLIGHIRDDAAYMIGYPGTKILDFSPLQSFTGQLINNIGDPYESAACYRLNTHKIEREVIDWFTHILHARPEDIWGYVTSGGTEGNMYGIYLARELYPDGMVYYSEDTHYSVSKVLRMVNARSIMIKSRPDGEIDYDDLAATIGIHRDIPPIIFANIGTTMKGAVDNIDRIRDILTEKAITRSYIHADAALSGMILPFTKEPQPFDFAAGINSISISGHKFPGIPMPCGIVMARKTLVDRIARSVEYIGTNDTTVLGSRNGTTPVFLWYTIRAIGEEGFRKIVRECSDMADYTIERFGKAGLKAWRHKNSITVVFPRIKEDILRKWQIAVQGKDAHLITMPHVTKNHIDRFIEELSA